jgi:hypothetical protein
MNRHLTFRPDLTDCVLEGRFVLATPNLGIIVLTQSGYALITPFPGANTSAAGSLGAGGPGGGSASSVSGALIPSGLYVTGFGGISSLRPGNITGNPSVGGVALGAVSTAVTSPVGSGANEASAAGTITVVTRNDVADPTQRPLLTLIGGATSTSSSPVLPPGQSYRDTAPVPPPAAYGVVAQPAPTTSTAVKGIPAPDPQSGAPTLGPFNQRQSMTIPRPGSLVPVYPMLPGNN